MRSYGMSKRKWASISSSPLLASVAESTVIFGPMGQLEQLGELAANLLERRVDAVERRRAGCNRAKLELGMRFHDLDRLPADRARGAEEGDPFHGSSVGSARSLAVVEAEHEVIRGR